MAELRRSSRDPEAAHFLFGQEQGEGVSAAPLLHLRLMGELALEGVQIYDLGGYIENVQPDHPYAGVNAFKDQFQGDLVRYAIPEFRIS